MGDATEIIRTGRKFEQVLEGARQVFLRDGFEGASVDEIARAAGVSKATLYSYFPDKRLLFVEVATLECSRMADRLIEQIDVARPPHEVLNLVAGQLVRFLLSDFAQRVFRICVAEADRFPELGRAFYASGPEAGCAQLGDYLACAHGRGELEVPNVRLAAEQFSELCKTRLWTRALFGIQTRFSEAEIDTVAEAAVATFLARYGT